LTSSIAISAELSKLDLLMYGIHLGCELSWPKLLRSKYTWGV